MVMSDAFEKEVISRLAAIETKIDAVCNDVDERRQDHIRLDAKVNAQGRDIARLQVKAGMWGALSGLVAGVAAAFGMKP